MLTKTLSEAKKKQRSILIKAMNNDIGSIDSSKDSWNPAQISERAKDISYIRSLVDTWNPAQLNEALKMLDLPIIDAWNPAQIEEQRRNLVFYLAERTLTGNPITLKILGNLTPEVTGLKVTMNPIQDLHGYSNPWAGGAGKNKYPLNDSTLTTTEMTITPLSNGKLRIQANTTAQRSIEISNTTIRNLVLLPTGDYTISVDRQLPNGISLQFSGSGNNGMAYGTMSGTTTYVSRTVTDSTKGFSYLTFVVPANVNVDFEVGVQIESGTTKTDWTPYSNICPISGRTEASVTRTGKNQCDTSAFGGVSHYTVNTDESITVNSSDTRSWSSVTEIPLKAGTYTVSKSGTTGTSDIRLSTEEFNTGHIFTTSFTFTLATDGSVKIKLAYGGITYPQTYTLQIESGSTATAYEPYTAETHTHQYSETIYGGVDDFVNGGLSNEWGYITSYDGETLPGEWISDRDVYAPDTTPTTGAEVAYKLATPTTISTSAEEITLLKGENVLSTDGDSIELKYKQNF